MNYLERVGMAWCFMVWPTMGRFKKQLLLQYWKVIACLCIKENYFFNYIGTYNNSKNWRRFKT